MATRSQMPTTREMVGAAIGGKKTDWVGIAVAAILLVTVFVSLGILVTLLADMLIKGWSVLAGRGWEFVTSPLSPDPEKAGLSLAPSLQVRPGRIGESPCSMECRLNQTVEFPRRSIVLGQVVQMHVRDDCLDAQGRYVRPDIYQPLARLHADNYIVADQQFVLKPNAPLKAAEAV